MQPCQRVKAAANLFRSIYRTLSGQLPYRLGCTSEKQFAGLGEIEKARIKTLLRRARETLALITKSNLPWVTDKDWLTNAAPLLLGNAAVFEGLIATHAKPPTIHHLHELNLAPTAEERILGTPTEYTRVSKIILLISHELQFIDPYLNPLKRSYSSVLKDMFEIVAKGRCQKLSMWARASEIFGYGDQTRIKKDVDGALRRLASEAGIPSGREIEMILVEDESRKMKMHGRYILSLKGGIRLDQGFQQLPYGRFVDIGPVGKATHESLLDIYLDNKHDMRLVDRLKITL